MSLTRELPIILKIDDESGLPLSITGAYVSIYNTWDDKWVDFTSTPSASYYCQTPTAAMTSGSSACVQTSGCSAGDYVLTGTVNPTSSLVVLVDGTQTTTGWTFTASSNTVTLSADLGGTIKFCYMSPTTNYAIYSLNTSALTDGKYVATVSCSGYSDIVEFSVLEGYPVPEVLFDEYVQSPSEYVLTTNYVTSAGSGIYGVKSAIYKNGSFLTSMLADSGASGVEHYVPSGSATIYSYKELYGIEPYTVNVTGDMTVSITGTYYYQLMDETPSGCVVYGTIVDLGLDPASGVDVSFRLKYLPQYSGDQFVSRDTYIVETTSGGFFQAMLPRNSEVLVEIYDAVPRKMITVPNSGTAKLKDLL